MQKVFFIFNRLEKRLVKHGNIRNTPVLSRRCINNGSMRNIVCLRQECVTAFLLQRHSRMTWLFKISKQSKQYWPYNSRASIWKGL